MSEISSKIISKEFIEIIKYGRNRAFQKVNEVLINMYWEIGKKLSLISKNANYVIII